MFPFSDSDVRHKSFPAVTLFLIAANILVFLYELYLGGFGLLSGGGDVDVVAFFAKWGFIPNELTQGIARTHQLVLTEIGIARVDIETPLPTWATLFSSMFIHGGFFHLAGNLMFLWVFGVNVEDWMGSFKFLVFYLLAGVAGALSHLAIDPDSLRPLIGASGAISGVMGAYMLLYPFNRVNTLIVFFIITVVRLHAVALLGLWFAWQLVQGFGSLAISDDVNVAFFAHVGGFVAGAVMTVAFKLVSRQPVWPSRQRAQPWDYWRRAGRSPD